MFCVECGKETNEELRDGLCAVCFLEKNKLAQLPDHVDLEVCVHCHARKRGELWVQGYGAMEPIVEEAVREAVAWDKRVTRPRADVEVVPEDERNFTVRALAHGVVEGLPFEQTLATRSRMKNATCLRCSRIQGGYYEAIVQVRATKRPLAPDEMRTVRHMASRLIERVVEGGDRNAFVLRDEEVHGGLDIYVGTTNAGRMMAKQLANEFGAKTSEHAKIVGQKDGLDLVRLTFAVRLPEYRAGDYLALGEEVVEVSSVGPKHVVLHEPLTGRTRHVERQTLERATVLPRRESREAVVVSHTEGELQILDPWSYQTVSVLRPQGLGDVGETVQVLRHDGELFVLKPGRADAA